MTSTLREIDAATGIGFRTLQRWAARGWLDGGRPGRGRLRRVTNGIKQAERLRRAIEKCPRCTERTLR